MLSQQIYISSLSVNLLSFGVGDMHVRCLVDAVYVSLNSKDNIYSNNDTYSWQATSGQCVDIINLCSTQFIDLGVFAQSTKMWSLEKIVSLNYKHMGYVTVEHSHSH